MSEHSPANVLAAWELLLEEVEGEIAWVNRIGAAAFAAGDHARAATALERAQKLGALHADVRALGERLRGLVEARPPAARPAGAQELRERLANGLKTADDAYRVPILRALVDMGGSAETGAVLDRVYATMKARLNEHDLAPLASDGSPRWRNTAQWCRNSMRQEGLIKDDSPHGVWQISEAGHKWLAEQTKDA